MMSDEELGKLEDRIVEMKMVRARLQEALDSHDPNLKVVLRETMESRLEWIDEDIADIEVHLHASRVDGDIREPIA